MGKQVKVEPEAASDRPRPHPKKQQRKVKIEQQAEVHADEPIKTEPEAEQPKTASSKKKHHRIIIRNLIVDANEKHLRKLCSKFGAITDISIPKHGVKNCGRGFAFVEFSKKNMCRKAVKELNQLSFKGRTIVVDMAVNKETFKQSATANASQNAEVPAEAQPHNEMKAQEEQVEEQKKAVTSTKKQAKVSDSEKKEEDLSQTVFVRNLPFNVTEQQLYKFMRPYGKIHFVKLVIDKETEEPKGTAFVKYREAEVAQRLIHYSRDYQQSLSAKPNAKKFQLNPTINLELEGRILKFFPAEKRTILNQKIESRDKKKDDAAAKKPKPLKKIKQLDDLVELDKHNKRNLHLADEGICRSESWMNREDTEKFDHNHKQKIEKLKNPNMFVSPTRMILKYLDRSISEEQLKDLCHKYIEEEHPTRHKLLNYCKLMLDDKREKSIGIAFVEFAKAEMSLGFLRWLKENRKSLFEQRSAVLAEFVIQDARKMSVLKKKIKKTK